MYSNHLIKRKEMIIIRFHQSSIMSSKNGQTTLEKETCIAQIVTHKPFLPSLQDLSWSLLSSFSFIDQSHISCLAPTNHYLVNGGIH